MSRRRLLTWPRPVWLTTGPGLWRLEVFHAGTRLTLEASPYQATVRAFDPDAEAYQQRAGAVGCDCGLDGRCCDADVCECVCHHVTKH